MSVYRGTAMKVIVVLGIIAFALLYFLAYSFRVFLHNARQPAPIEHGVSAEGSSRPSAQPVEPGLAGAPHSGLSSPERGNAGQGSSIDVENLQGRSTRGK
ncbi:MAG TPA: hypothetical protein ENN80_13375 [Candidatus Hydrogenedentes bacterium]|nr:hypothetical protein [Candidatus Hydrogenedentota bacterium]